MCDSFPDDNPASKVEVNDFPARLKKAIGDQSIRGFARNCGFSDTVLRQYLSGQSEPTRPALLAIARTANVSVEWLAAGQVATQDSIKALTQKYSYKSPLAFDTDWLKEQFPKSFENLFLTEVLDESMEPTLQMGDLVLVNTNERDLTAVNHGIYLLKLDDHILIKRLQYVAEHTLRVLSDNLAYENFSLELSEQSLSVSLMGKVVWFSRKL
ncbi:MAG: XRE family transcriptional regulator [Thainema sp.]